MARPGDTVRNWALACHSNRASRQLPLTGWESTSSERDVTSRFIGARLKPSTHSRRAARGHCVPPFFVNVYAGMNFQFTNADAGYEQVMAEMAKHLMDLAQSRAESVGSWKTDDDIPEVWRRDIRTRPRAPPAASDSCPVIARGGPCPETVGGLRSPGPMGQLLGANVRAINHRARR